MSGTNDYSSLADVKDIGGNSLVLEARDVTKRYSRRGVRAQTLALDHVSMWVHAGDTLGIVGESGSGKTTLSRLLLDLERPTDGSIFFRGADIANLDRGGRKAFRQRVA